MMHVYMYLDAQIILNLAIGNTFKLCPLDVTLPIFE